MNKYQKALNIFCEQNTFKDISKDVLNKNYLILKELVEKATPMRVTDIHVDEFYCPKCDSEISHDYDCQLPNFCKECGQRLE